MGWIEKASPTPFDAELMNGLYYLDGDIISRKTQQWVTQGKKFPTLAFPSGIHCELVEGYLPHQPFFIVFDAMRLPTQTAIQEAYQEAMAYAEQYGYLVTRPTTDTLEVWGHEPDEHYLVTYDPSRQRVTNVEPVPEPADAKSGYGTEPLNAAAANAQEILHIKDQIMEAFNQLPSEHRASMALVIFNTVLQSEWGAWLQEAVAIKSRIELSPENPPQAFQITRDHLKQLHLTPPGNCLTV
jgi:hypothetical protein